MWCEGALTPSRGLGWPNPREGGGQRSSEVATGDTSRDTEQGTDVEKGQRGGGHKDSADSFILKNVTVIQTQPKCIASHGTNMFLLVIRHS